jgi:hypothetical protein
MTETLELLIDLNSSGIEKKVSGLLSSVNSTFQQFSSGKFDWSKYTDGLGSVNWTSVIGKLFTPANLITFFSAMAATGIVAAATQQQAAATGTPAGAGLTAGQQSGVITASQGIANTTGQSTDDNTVAIETLLPALGDNVTAAQALAQQVAEVAASEGVSTTSVAQSLAPLLQSLGISDLSDAEALLTSFANSAVQSGTNISTLIDAWSQFAPQVKEANISQTALNNAVQQFGASVEGAGLPGATAAFQLLFDSITPTANQLAFSTLAGGAGKLKAAIADGSTATALNDIAGAIKTMAVGGNLALLNTEFGVNATAIAAVIGQLTTYPIVTQQTIDQLFKDTNTSLRAFNEALQTFQNLAATTVGAPLLALLTGVVEAVTFLMQNNSALLIASGVFVTLAGLSFTGLISTLAALPAAAAAITALASGTATTAAGGLVAAEGGVGLVAALTLAGTVITAMGVVLAGIGVGSAVAKYGVTDSAKNAIVQSGADQSVVSAIYGDGTAANPGLISKIFPQKIIDYFDSANNPFSNMVQSYVGNVTDGIYNPTVGTGVTGGGGSTSTLKVVVSTAPGTSATTALSNGSASLMAGAGTSTSTYNIK